MKYFIIILTAILTSCSGNTQESTNSNEIKTKTKKESSCLTGLENPNDWYTVSSIASISGVSEEKIKKNTRTGNINLLTFRIKEKREKVNWSDISIMIKNIDEAIKKDSERYNRKYTYEEYFQAYHAPVTKKDQKKIDEEIDKKGEEDKSFDTKTAKSALSYLTPHSSGELENFGERAHYKVYDQVLEESVSLTVMHKNVVIEVSVELFDDEEEDLRVAKQIAQDIMTLCD